MDLNAAQRVIDHDDVLDQKSTMIEERCLRPDAAFGDADNLRTTRRHHPGGAAAGG